MTVIISVITCRFNSTLNANQKHGLFIRNSHSSTSADDDYEDDIRKQVHVSSDNKDL